jgi:hypothetical protein
MRTKIPVGFILNALKGDTNDPPSAEFQQQNQRLPFPVAALHLLHDKYRNLFLINSMATH